MILISSHRNRFQYLSCPGKASFCTVWHFDRKSASWHEKFYL